MRPGQHPWLEIPTDEDGLLLKHQWLDGRFRRENNGVDLMCVLLHCYRVRQVEPLGEAERHSS